MIETCYMIHISVRVYDSCGHRTEILFFQGPNLRNMTVVQCYNNCGYTLQIEHACAGEDYGCTSRFGAVTDTAVAISAY